MSCKIEEDGALVALRQAITKDKHAGSKGVKDIDDVVDRFSPRIIWNYSLDNNVSDRQKKNPAYYVKRLINCVKTILSLSHCKDKALIVHYPDYSPKIIQFYIKKLFLSNKTVFIIHDIDSWRGITTYTDEYQILNSATVLVVHNQRMKNKLLSRGVKNPKMVDVEIFDYLLDQPVGTQKFRKTLNFAGNLAKSKFLYKLCYADLKYDIDLFGVGFDDTMVLPNNIKFRGSFSPNDLPYKMNGGFGLVWDGESIESCTGLMGEYTQWNNPHKLSLYIAAGLPIFAWNKAAISDTIKKYDIGFCVDSLEEINYIMNNLTEERYLQLILNLAPLKKMVSEGKFLEKAIDEVVNVLKSKNY